MKKQRRSRAEILNDKLQKLREKREDRIDRYILPIESEIEKVKEQLRQHYAAKNIYLPQ